VKKRRICYDTEPYYLPDKEGRLFQIGYQLNLYGTFSGPAEHITVDSAEYQEVERDLRRVAEALSQSCNPYHMCELTTIDPATLTYSHERKMRPDVTVHVPIFDQQHFGRPVDDNITKTLEAAIKLVESAGVRRKHWPD